MRTDRIRKAGLGIPYSEAYVGAENEMTKQRQDGPSKGNSMYKGPTI